MTRLLMALAGLAALAPPARAEGDPRALVDAALRIEDMASPDHEAAAALFARAAAAGSPEGMMHLAMAFEWGLGVMPDACRADGLYAQAEDGGNPLARIYRFLLGQHADTTNCTNL